MKKAFTLLELIIVIIVVGILVAFALPQFANVSERARMTKCLEILDMFRQAEGIYYGLYSYYTDDPDDLAVDMPEVLNVDDIDWSYTISSADLNSEFLITGDRQRGEHTGETLTMDQLGVIGGTHPLQ